MKKSIGIRVTPSVIFFALVSENKKGITIELIDRLNNPQALEIPEQLKFIRNNLCDIINEFDITNACIRITEPSAQSLSLERIYIEGVIQELFASSTISSYYVGQISSISKRLGMDRQDFKPYAEGKKDFMEIAGWGRYDLEERESIMAAFSALNI